MKPLTSLILVLFTSGLFANAAFGQASVKNLPSKWYTVKDKSGHCTEGDFVDYLGWIKERGFKHEVRNWIDDADVVHQVELTVYVSEKEIWYNHWYRSLAVCEQAIQAEKSQRESALDKYR